MISAILPDPTDISRARRMTPPEAARLTAHLNGDVDEDWDYRVKILDSGAAVVKVYDEENVFIGYL